METGHDKVVYLTEKLADRNQLTRYEEGSLPAYLHLQIQSGIVLIYALFQLGLVRQAWRREHAGQSDAGSVPRSTLRWLWLFSGMLAVLTSMYFAATLMPGVFAGAFFYLLNGLVATLVLLLFAVLLFFPHVLYGLTPEALGEAPESYSASIVNVDEIQRNLKVIKRVMQEEKSFLKTSFSLSDLANETDIPRHRLSATINEGLHVNFNELINRHRVRYAVDELPPQKWKSLSVEGIGLECGFHSRTTFSRAFKKEMGMPPSAYRKRLLKNVQ